MPRGWRRCASRIRAAYGVPDEVAVVFAPSGTDLEYVALALVAGRAPAGTHAVLLGADEVGSGCIHSAHGLYFANETALGVATVPGDPVPGLGGVHVEMVDIPVRDRMGRVRPSHYLTERMLVLDRGGARGQPAQPGPYRPRLEDRPDPALAGRCRPAVGRRDPGGRCLPGADHQRRR